MTKMQVSEYLVLAGHVADHVPGKYFSRQQIKE